MKDSPPKRVHATGGARSRPQSVPLPNTLLPAAPLACTAQQTTNCAKRGTSWSAMRTVRSSEDDELCSNRSRRPLLVSERRRACTTQSSGPLEFRHETQRSAAQSEANNREKQLRRLQCCPETQKSGHNQPDSASCVETIETIMTCEGDLNSPHFKRRFAALKSKLTRLLKTSRRSLNVKKMEPWNSVKVTMQLPRRLAEKLKKLAESDGELLRSLGILGIQVQGDRHINLQLGNIALQQSSSATQSSNIASIINQLVSASDTDQHAQTESSAAVDCAGSSNASSSSSVHQPNCAFLLRQVHVDATDSKAECSRKPEHCEPSADVDDDQVVCTCGIASASLTPASSNSATSVNAFNVPVPAKQSPRPAAEGCPLTLPEPPPLASNGCSSNCFSPPPSAREPVNGARHSSGTSDSPVAPNRSPAAVPASLSNFAADLAVREHAAANALFFTLNDDNILDDGLAANGSQDPEASNGTCDSRCSDTVQPECLNSQDHSKVAADDAFARPLRPQPSISLRPNEKADRVHIIKLPSLEESPRSVKPLVRPDANALSSQVRIIQIPSKSAANNHVAPRSGTQQNTLATQSTRLAALETHGNANGVLNGTHDTSSWPNTPVKRIRVETNSHTVRSTSESDEDAVS